jgi:hypothetical protein
MNTTKQIADHFGTYLVPGKFEGGTFLDEDVYSLTNDIMPQDEQFIGASGYSISLIDDPFDEFDFDSVEDIKFATTTATAAVVEENEWGQVTTNYFDNLDEARKFYEDRVKNF